MNYHPAIDVAFAFCVGIVLGGGLMLWFRNRAVNSAAMERQEKGDTDDSCDEQRRGGVN